ncbi:MAG: enoyl-CoA hydratase, partial [Gammaproteobacteria bacterium CG22_combo_CG10-13_8_21_14_all_40_8]
DQIQAIFTQIKNNKDVHGVVIISGKPDGFIAGADIKVLEKLKTIQDA